MEKHKQKMETGDVVFDAAKVTCKRHENGQLVICHNGELIEDVQMIPTFPLSRSRRMIAVLDSEGREIGFLDDAAKMNSDSRHAVKDALERSYFMPRITEILYVEEKLNVLTLEVQTNRGFRTIQVRNARRHIRKLPHNRVVIRDVDGNRYEIRDWTCLSSYGRDLMGQYM